MEISKILSYLIVLFTISIILVFVSSAEIGLIACSAGLIIGSILIITIGLKEKKEKNHNNTKSELDS